MKTRTKYVIVDRLLLYYIRDQWDTWQSDDGSGRFANKDNFITHEKNPSFSLSKITKDAISFHERQTK
jgi:hypothetical protein